MVRFAIFLALVAAQPSQDLPDEVAVSEQRLLNEIRTPSTYKLMRYSAYGYSLPKDAIDMKFYTEIPAEYYDQNQMTCLRRITLEYDAHNANGALVRTTATYWAVTALGNAPLLVSGSRNRLTDRRFIQGIRNGGAQQCGKPYFIKK